MSCVIGKSVQNYKVVLTTIQDKIRLIIIFSRFLT